MYVCTPKDAVTEDNNMKMLNRIFVIRMWMTVSCQIPSVKTGRRLGKGGKPENRLFGCFLFCFYLEIRCFLMCTLECGMMFSHFAVSTISILYADDGKSSLDVWCSWCVCVRVCVHAHTHVLLFMYVCRCIHVCCVCAYWSVCVLSKCCFTSEQIKYKLVSL